jgi:hypothetical protein
VPRLIDDPVVPTATRALLGVIDVDGGPTDEQANVLAAIVAGYWERPDLTVGALPALDPAGAAAAIVDEAQRRRLAELIVVLEMCRHPLSAAQVDRADEYLTALGGGAPGLELARDLVRGGAELASADYYRLLDGHVADLAEPSLLERYGADLPEPDAELGDRIRAMGDLPAGTLGHEFLAFHRRNGFDLPGDNPRLPAVYVSHDMCHVIAGYEPTGQGEIALGAMQLAMSDSDVHWIQLLGNLAVHEAGYLISEAAVSHEGALARPGASELLAEAFGRGARCTEDFTTADHLAMVDRPLAEVRARFGIPPLGALAPS